MPQIISNGIKYTNGNPFSGKYEDLEGKPTVFGPSGPKAKEGFVPSPGTTAGTTKYLREDGTWAVPLDTDTTYSDMKGATASSAGEHGLAPAPSAGAKNKYLTGGATYQNVDDHAATFTSTDIDDGSANAWTNVAKLTSGEKHSSIFNKLSTMFKNVRYLYRVLGTTDISGIGDGTVTGAIRELNTGTIYLGTIDHVLTDSEIGNIAKIYSIPDFKAYIAVMLPIVEEPFLQAGGSHVVFGMEYGIHKWGFQMSFGYLIKHRILSNGVWGGWKNVTMS